jgi:hypothetical protein
VRHCQHPHGPVLASRTAVSARLARVGASGTGGDVRPRSARAERHGDGDDRLWRVLGSGQVPVEHTAHEVARQVLKDRIDDELVGPWRPRLARQQAPRPLLRPRLRHAVDGLTGRV